MTVVIRELGPADHRHGLERPQALVPEETPAGIAGMTNDGASGHLAELCLRADANGCSTRPAGFLEAVRVARDLRGQGVGRALVVQLEAVTRADGLREIRSDALIDDAPSHAAHRASGFAEAERVVCFVNAL